MIISFVSVMYKIRSIKHGIFFLKKKDILFMCVEYMIINKRVIYRCIFFLFNGDEKKGEERKSQACLLILFNTERDNNSRINVKRHFNR